MSESKIKFNLIMDNERQLARAIAYAAIPAERLSVWDVMIPFVFITGHLKLKEKRKHCVQNLLFTKRLALEAALTMVNSSVSRTEALHWADTETLKVLTSVDKGIYANAIRERQMAEIALLIDHFHTLLTASGDNCAALIKTVYRDKEELNRFFSRLGKAEQRVAQSACQFLNEQADTAMGQRIERCSHQVRRKWVRQLFGHKLLETDDCPDNKRSCHTGRTWRDRIGQWFSLHGEHNPDLSDEQDDGAGSTKSRRWKLLQVETALACNLRCVMCPWQEIRQKNSANGGMMSPKIWETLRPHLSNIATVDFTGGGEPLLQPHLADWVGQAHQAGCETGLLTNAIALTQDKALCLMDAGIDWIGISMDGADAATYEQIRQGADFDKVCRQVKVISTLRTGLKPKLMINFVLMQNNTHQLDRMVQLAVELGVDQLNFKQCDVIRGNFGHGLGVFASAPDKPIRQLESRLAKARRRAKKAGLSTTAFAFTPEAQPVCGQDPTASMFVGHDGAVGPCINQVLGGSTTFFGREAIMPTCHYGRLDKEDLTQLWESDRCRRLRQKFRNRVRTYEAVYARRFIEGAAGRDQTESEARRALPSPPSGCRICHYLYNV